MADRISIGFTGDLSFSGYFQKQYTNDQLITDEVKDFLNSNDANVINYESPITPCRMTKKKRLAHRSEPEALDFIKRNINNPVLSFANNHMMDYKAIGVIDTVDNTQAAGIPFIGAGKNEEQASQYVILGDDIKVGVLSVQYKKFRKPGRNFIGPLHEDMTDILTKRISELRPQVDWLVLVYHGGDEFLYSPMPYIRKLLKKYLDFGCDVIVAHHPHVVQGYEYFGKKAVFYSLGNFIFDTDYQRVQEGTDKGMVLRLTFTKDSFSFDNMPTFIDRDMPQIRKGEDDPHFCDIKEKDYAAMWTQQATRKLEVLERAAELKEKELQERAIVSEKEAIKAEQLRRAAELKKAQMEKAENDDESDLEQTAEETEENNEGTPEEVTVARSKGFRKKLKAVYRKLIVKRKENHRSFTLKRGRLQCKLFHKNKKVF